MTVTNTHSLSLSLSLPPSLSPSFLHTQLYSQEYHHSSASNGPAGSHTHNASSSRSSVGTANKDLSNLDNPLSKNTGNNLSSVGPSTSKVFITQGSLNISLSKHNRDISVTQNDASNSNLSTRRGPVVQTVISSYGIKSKDPSTRGDLSNRSPYKSSKDLFASSNPSLTPSNSKNKEAVFTQGRRTKTNAPSSSSHGNTKLVSKKRGTSATQISLNIPTHSGPLRCATPLSSSNTPSPGRSHSRSMTPSSIRQSSPDFEPYVRVIDPVYHDDPQLERWRQLMQAHWFEVKMVKSRQPLSMAEKRSLKQFGLLDDHNQ